MKKWKYPDDFEGWKDLGKLFSNRYTVLKSPDGLFLALIHLEDNDVAIVMGRQPGGDIYGGDPFVIRNLKRILKIREEMDKTAADVYRKAHM